MSGSPQVVGSMLPQQFKSSDPLPGVAAWRDNQFEVISTDYIGRAFPWLWARNERLVQLSSAIKELHQAVLSEKGELYRQLILSLSDSDSKVNFRAKLYEINSELCRANERPLILRYLIDIANVALNLLGFVPIYIKHYDTFSDKVLTEVALLGERRVARSPQTLPLGKETDLEMFDGIPSGAAKIEIGINKVTMALAEDATVCELDANCLIPSDGNSFDLQFGVKYRLKVGQVTRQFTIAEPIDLKIKTEFTLTEERAQEVRELLAKRGGTAPFIAGVNLKMNNGHVFVVAEPGSKGLNFKTVEIEAPVLFGVQVMKCKIKPGQMYSFSQEGVVHAFSLEGKSQISWETVIE